ncbi:MAG: DUF1684 domain-containing protein [Bacteroidia bacterium]
MKHIIIFFAIISLAFSLQAQEGSYMERLQKYQAEQNAEFADSSASPLTAEDRATFEALDFYPIDSTFCVQARFVRTEGSKPFEMKTTTARKPVYEKYGEAHFVINGDSLMLTLYQSHRSMNHPIYKDYLFLPYTDSTSGDESYGGGRFIDVRIPEGDTIEIDFNKSYNPYCAYNHKYSCPVPPSENYLDVAVRAGVKKYH